MNIHVSIHSINQQVFFEYLLCVKYSTRYFKIHEDSDKPGLPLCTLRAWSKKYKNEGKNKKKPLKELEVMDFRK